MFHGKEIKGHIEKVHTDYDAGDYYGTGVESAAVVLGLVPEDSEVDKLMLEYVLN